MTSLKVNAFRLSRPVARWVPCHFSLHSPPDTSTAFGQIAWYPESVPGGACTAPASMVRMLAGAILLETTRPLMSRGDLVYLDEH
jgi:hypothetical protein